jgi:hypothetical protein
LLDAQGGAPNAIEIAPNCQPIFFSPTQTSQPNEPCEDANGAKNSNHRSDSNATAKAPSPEHPAPQTPADASETKGKRAHWRGEWITNFSGTSIVKSSLDAVECTSCDSTSCRALPPVERLVLSYVRAHVRVTKVVLDCGVCRNGCTFFRAPWPDTVEEPLFERGIATASMVAAVMTDHSKYGIPVYTQKKQLAEGNLTIPYGALLRWRGQGITAMAPVYKFMNERSQFVERLIVDDTRYLALKLDALPLEKKTINGRMWSKTDGTSFAIFGYAENWKASFLDTFIGQFVGIMIGDGYAGYPAFAAENGLEGLAGCNDHSRRKFCDAALLNDAQATHTVSEYSTIYKVESDAKKEQMSADELLHARQTIAKPAFERLRTALLKAQAHAVPRSALDRAITYFLRNYERLTLYLDNASIPMSTAFVERLLRSVAKVRKNSLFVGSVESGQQLAINLTLMASCQIVGICYYTYLLDVLPKVAGTGFPANRIEELVPDRWAELRGLGRHRPREDATWDLRTQLRSGRSPVANYRAKRLHEGLFMATGFPAG